MSLCKAENTWAENQLVEAGVHTFKPTHVAFGMDPCRGDHLLFWKPASP